MDRFAAHLVATSVLTAALAAVPTAMAGSVPAQAAVSAVGPATPNPGGPLQALGKAPAAAAQPSRPLARPATAEPVPCPDARQVGPTEHAFWHGEIAFSVKQFYSPSCHASYGYAFPWLQFRDEHVDYSLGLGVFDVTHDAIDGARTFIDGADGPDFWSEPVPVGAHTCTQGLAHVFYPDDETDTFTVKFCL
jgi:hypothetical protein